MSAQVDVARSYMEAYGRGDVQGVAACLTEDVVWDVHGHAHLEGKAAYLAEMEQNVANPPDVIAERYLEDGDVVVVLGRVRAPLPGGAEFRAVFSDVFTFRDGLAARVESYVVPLGPDR